MRISVITPVFNGENYIEETVVSVLKAIGDRHIEYIVVNDGSTDTTSTILDKYLGKIKVIDQPNRGESAAVNTGFQSASGDFLLVVSADDPLFTPLIFEDVSQHFDANQNLVVWYPDWRMIDESGEVVRSVKVQEYSDEKLIGRFLCLPGPGAFIRKSAALAINGRRSCWKYVGDYDFWLRISRIGELERRPETLAQWRLHEESTSISQRGFAMFDERINVIEDFVSQNELDPELVRMARAHSMYFASLLAFYSPEIPGKKFLLKAFLVRRKWVEEAQLRVVVYILLTPFSSRLTPFVNKFFGRWVRGRR